mgnify:CR=1 FL=1
MFCLICVPMPSSKRPPDIFCRSQLASATFIGLRGKTISLQAKLKTTAAITDVRMAVLEWTGTADSVTSDVVGTWGSAGTNPTLASNWAYLGTPANLSVTTSWATYRVEGLTVGASANNLAVFIWCEDETTTVTTDSLLVTDVQLEEGPTCSGFERRPYGHELWLCQRYYEALGGVATFEPLGMGQYISTTVGRIFVQFANRKRIAPTAAVSNIAHFELSFGAGSSATCSGSISTAYNGPTGRAVDFTIGAFGTPGNAVLLFTNTTSARFAFDAEM